MEVHRNREDKQAKAQAASRSNSGVECQPNIAAPLLRDEKARREWVERELDICCQVPTSFAAYASQALLHLSASKQLVPLS